MVIDGETYQTTAAVSKHHLTGAAKTGLDIFRHGGIIIHMITTTRLDNGVRIITHSLPHMHTVSTGIWVAGGARQEPADVNGIAHFIEHLLFKGTKRRSSRQISLEMDSMGGVLNAFTGHEYVCYYGKVLASFLPRAADLLSDIFLNSVFPHEEIERERKVVLQEIKMHDDDPEQYIHERFHRNFWSGSSLGAPILGTEETVAGMSRDAIVAYKHNRYTPSNIVISAAGRVEHNQVVDLFSDAFGAMEDGRTGSSGELPVTAPGRQVNQTVRDLEQSLVCMGTAGLAQGDPRRFALYLLSTVLGGGMSSRLFQEIREKRGLAYSVYSYVISHADSGAMVIYSGTGPEQCRQVIDLVCAEIGRIKRESVPADELNSAREQLKGKLMMTLESTDSLMTRLAKDELYLGRSQPLEDVLAGFDAVTPDDIRDLAGTLFDGSRLNLELMGRAGCIDMQHDEIRF